MSINAESLAARNLYESHIALIGALKMHSIGAISQTAVDTFTSRYIASSIMLKHVLAPTTALSLHLDGMLVAFSRCQCENEPKCSCGHDQNTMWKIEYWPVEEEIPHKEEAHEAPVQTSA